MNSDEILFAKQFMKKNKILRNSNIVECKNQFLLLLIKSLFPKSSHYHCQIFIVPHIQINFINSSAFLPEFLGFIRKLKILFSYCPTKLSSNFLLA